MAYDISNAIILIGEVAISGVDEAESLDTDGMLMQPLELSSEAEGRPMLAWAPACDTAALH